MIARPECRATRRMAFTLMEVLVVVAILVILVSVVGIGVFSYLESAKEQSAKLMVNNLDSAVQKYKILYQDYPVQLLDLTLPMPDGKPAVFDQSQLMDPWGRPYIYEPQNLHPLKGNPHIYSEGANPGSGAIISNWGAAAGGI